jgi:hypothetical protein
VTSGQCGRSLESSRSVRPNPRRTQENSGTIPPVCQGHAGRGQAPRDRRAAVNSESSSPSPPAWPGPTG